jgi:hypothetical protein
MYHIA